MISIGRLASNKWVSRTVDIAYIIGFIISIEGGWMLKYVFYTTLVLCILFYKPLYQIMKMGGDLYADWCREKSYKITKKVYKDYSIPEMEKKLEEEKVKNEKKSS